MRRLRLAAFTTACVAALAIDAAPAAAATCSERGDDIACTDLGAVRGAPDGATTGFKAIPYASPPVGTLRWRAPQPAQAWSIMRDGSRYGANCPQLVGNNVEGDEDCLFVNV